MRFSIYSSFTRSILRCITHTHSMYCRYVWAAALCLYSVLMRGLLCCVPQPSRPDAAVVLLIVTFISSLFYKRSHIHTLSFPFWAPALLDDWPDCRMLCVSAFVPVCISAWKALPCSSISPLSFKPRKQSPQSCRLLIQRHHFASQHDMQQHKF